MKVKGKIVCDVDLEIFDVSVPPPPTENVYTLVLNSPTEGQTLSNSVTLSASLFLNGSPTTGVIKFELLNNGQTQEIGSVFNTTSFLNGSYKIRATYGTVVSPYVNVNISNVVTPPPPPPPTGNVVVTVTQPAANAIWIGSVDVDSTVTVSGASPASGLLEYEILSSGGTSSRIGRQSNAPWTHSLDSSDYPDGSYKIRAIWITSETEVYSPWVNFSISNNPVVPPPPPPPPPGSTGKTWIVSTDAELTNILINSAVQPGDRVLIAPGRYKGTRRVRLRGLPGKRVVIEAAKLGDVIIDIGAMDDPNGGLYFDVGSNYCLVRNLIVVSTKQGRSGEHAQGFNVLYGNQRIERCVVVGSAQGYFWSKAAVGDPSNVAADANDPPGARYCFFYHNGHTMPGTTRGHGHAGYAQGDYRQFHGLVSVGGFGMGTRFWGSGDAWAKYSGIRASVNVNTGALYNGQMFGPTCITIGADTSPVGCYLDHVHNWCSKMTEGGSWVGDPFENGIQDQVSTTNCFFVGGSLPMQWNYLKRCVATNNTIVADKPALQCRLKPLPGAASIGLFENNKFFGSSDIYRLGTQNDGMANLVAKYPTCKYSAGRPADSVHVYPDPDGGKYALVVVYNWSKQATVSFDVPWSGNVTVKNALDILGESVGTVNGTRVTVNMQNQSIAQPLPEMGINVKNVAGIWDASGKFMHPGVEFGCFFVDVQ